MKTGTFHTSQEAITKFVNTNSQLSTSNLLYFNKGNNRRFHNYTKYRGREQQYYLQYNTK